GSVSGRGLLRRSYADRVRLAADYKTGALKVDPSFKSTCETFDVSPADLRAELKARTTTANGNGHSAAVERFVGAWQCPPIGERVAVLSAINAVYPMDPDDMAAQLVCAVGVDTAVDLVASADAESQ